MHLRLAIRSLRATPVVTAVAILSLALGIGANTAIFSLINSLLLRPLPVERPDRLVAVSIGNASIEASDVGYSTFDQIRRHPDGFSAALAFSHCCSQATVTAGRERWPVERFFVSGDFFSTLGLAPAAGRLLTPADDVAGGGAIGVSAVISYRVWRERFDGRADVVGAPIVVDRAPVTIVGVAPRAFLGLDVGRRFDVILPAKAQPTVAPSIAFEDTTPWLTVMLRLRPGTSIDAAERLLRAAQPQIRAASNPGNVRADFLSAPFTLSPIGHGMSGLRTRLQRPLVALLAVVAVVLLVACANLANLQLARAAGRRRELSVRIALGASRAQLASQMLAESAVLAATGTMAGLLFARLATRAIVVQISSAAMPVVLDLSPDWRLFAFTSAVMMACLFGFGTAPAIRAARVTPVDALKEHGRAAGAAAGRWATTLVVSQVALSLLLVVSAGLFVSTFDRLAHVSLGFDRDRTTVITLTAPTVPATERNVFYHRLVRALAGVPGVAHAGGSMNPPLIGTLHGDLVLTHAGVAAPPGAAVVAQGTDVTPGWIEAYGLPIIAGRAFDDRDTLASQPAIIVNEAVVHRMFPGEQLVGTPLLMTFRSQEFGDIPIGVKTVVGIAGDAVFRSMRAPAEPTVYTPLAQRSDPMLWTYFYITVQAKAGSPALLTRSLTDTLHAIDPDLTLSFRPVAEQVDEALAQDRLVAILSAFFGALALLLAAVGQYCVTAYAVAQRRFEIGIRMALGATAPVIARAVLARVAALVAAGVVLGGAVSAWATRFAASLLYGVGPRDAKTFSTATVVLAVVAALAAWLPTYRASHTDPAAVLRES
jgi:putative ABC transport system permease protein